MSLCFLFRFLLYAEIYLEAFSFCFALLVTILGMFSF